MNDFQQALERACAAVGLASDGARRLRLGSNAVYHLKAPVIVRVCRPGTAIAPARRSVAVARWLESANYPAVRAIDVVQPVIADGYVATSRAHRGDPEGPLAGCTRNVFGSHTWPNVPVYCPDCENY